MNVPETMKTADVFPRVFWMVAEGGYMNCDPDNFETQDDFNTAVAQCIDETLGVLGIVQPEGVDGAQWVGEFYEMLEDNGLEEWPDEEDET